MCQMRVRRDLRDKQGGEDAEQGRLEDRIRDDQIVSPRGKGEYMGGKGDEKPKKSREIKKKMGDPRNEKRIWFLKSFYFIESNA